MAIFQIASRSKRFLLNSGDGDPRNLTDAKKGSAALSHMHASGIPSSSKRLSVETSQMNTKAAFTWIGAILGLLVTQAFAQTKPSILTIHVDTPVSRVSPILYGLMTEEINYSYDGGLYGEMVRNRTFRANRSNVPYWILCEEGDAEAKMQVDRQTGPSEALNYGLRLDVTKADPQNQAGILNQGFWGMALMPNTTYKGSLYAKADSDAVGELSIKLVSDAENKTLASTTIPAVTGSWKR